MNDLMSAYGQTVTGHIVEDADRARKRAESLAIQEYTVIKARYEAARRAIEELIPGYLTAEQPAPKAKKVKVEGESV